MVPADLLNSVHDFWFGELSARDSYPAERAEIWFREDPPTDAAIRSLFGPFLDAVAGLDVDAPSLPRIEAAGFIVMLDQFPRNLFRGAARAFAYDALARHHARLIDDAGTARFALIERVFLVLPFEHSEAIEDQDRAVSLFERLLIEAPLEQKAHYESFLDYALKHRAVIHRFGRFPHRNAALGRVTTPAEGEFLAEHGRGF